MTPGVDAFLIYNGKILLVKRENISSIAYPNYWNLPGGGVEVDETDDEAIEREVEEEVGLQGLQFVFISKDSFEDGNVVSKYYAKLTAAQVQTIDILEEGQDFGFFTLSVMLEMQIIPNLRRYVVEHYESLLLLLFE